VTVDTQMAVRGTDGGDFRFGVARATGAPEPRVDPPRGKGEVQRFRTRPDLKPPAITIDVRTGEAGPGYVFLAPKRGRGQDGPMILDGRGKVVWARSAPVGEQAANFRVQRYGRRPVLTWWEGGTNVGVGFGEGVILDQSYRELMRVRAGNGYRAGLHEFLLTPRGTALFIVYSFVKADLSSVGGPRDGAAVDGVVQEVDLGTGLVVFEWHSLDAIDLAESRWPLPERPSAAYDYVHLNSVDVDDDGNLLVSARHSWAVYKIDRQTAAVSWRLGGRRSDFELPREARFAFQHDARRRADGALTLFDNAAGPPATRKASRAMALELDEQDRTVRLLSELEHPDGALSDSQGNAQNMPNGNTFVGWGSLPLFTEYTDEGRVAYAGRIAEGNDNYRAFRASWTGRPATRPAAIAETRDGATVVIASWNGATRVARWQALAGDRREDLRPAGLAGRRGFETPVRVRRGDARWVAARALDASGATLGTSEPLRAPG
jgi:hypothetical protein